MFFENKFLFIGKSFLVIFIIVNLANLFPIQIFNVYYYTNFINIFLDTSSLLLLGLSIPRFLTLRKIHLLSKLKNNRKEEINDINTEIRKLEQKGISNFKLIRFCAAFFVVIFISQPINLIFVLNRNEIYVNRAITVLNKALNDKKSELIKMNKNNNNELKEDKEVSEMLSMMDVNYERNIDNLIKNNNVNKFNQIKFIVRNLLMSFIWAFAFFKLSTINLDE